MITVNQVGQADHIPQLFKQLLPFENVLSWAHSRLIGLDGPKRAEPNLTSYVIVIPCPRLEDPVPRAPRHRT